ncbi:MAG: DMT family transporter [Litorivicinaceae bacterium]
MSIITFFPLIFVLLWASAFVTGKVIVVDATPFAALAFRFLFVTLGFFLVMTWRREWQRAPLRSVGEAVGTGILFHGVYLAGVFYAVMNGLPAGITALIVSLQPLLTSALAGPLLSEAVSRRQWMGLAIGFSGTACVLGFDVGTSLPTMGLVSAVIALLAVTSGTLWQKTLTGKLPLATSNGYQAAAALLFHVTLMGMFEHPPKLEPTLPLVVAMGWQVFAVSFGAFTILMYLIAHNSASKTSALFFLVPPVAALISWAILDETLTGLDIFGFVIASYGVYVATRPNPMAQTT